MSAGETVQRLLGRINQVDGLIDRAFQRMEDTDNRRYNLRLDEDKRKEAKEEYSAASALYKQWISLQIQLTKSYDEASKLDSESTVETQDKHLTVLEQLRQGQNS